MCPALMKNACCLMVQMNKNVYLQLISLSICYSLPKFLQLYAFPPTAPNPSSKQAEETRRSSSRHPGFRFTAAMEAAHQGGARRGGARCPLRPALPVRSAATCSPPARFCPAPAALSGHAGGAQGSAADPHQPIFGAGHLQQPPPPAAPAAAAAASAPRGDGGGGGGDAGPARHGCPAPAAGGWPQWALGRWGRWQRRRGQPGAGCRRGRTRVRRAPRQRGFGGDPRRCGRS